MSPTKLVLAQMQENEKKYYQENECLFSVERIQLNMCRAYLKDLMVSTLNRFELRNDIQEFLKSLNNK